MVVPSANVEPLGGLQAIASGAIGSPPLSALTTYVSIAPAGLVASAVCPGGNLRFGGAAFTVHDRAAGLVCVAGCVGGSNLERVGSVGKSRVRLGRAAGLKTAAVEAASKRRT